MHTLSICIIAFLALVISAKWIVQDTSRRRDIEYASLALEAVKKILTDKLGTRGLQVFSFWADGLDQISDESIDEEAMVGIFLKYVRDGMKVQNVAITPIELALVKRAVITTVKLVGVKPGPTKAAAKALIALLPIQ